MSEKQKTVAAIHDLSGFGRCALSVILPVISAMGIQCVPVPTAVLSTHTGGFSGFVLRDMTDYLSPCCAHYRKLGLSFDAVYTGFLASEEQADCCMEFFRAFPSALKVVDPVMGDSGAAYQTYTGGLIQRMAELARCADVITPNPTEAAILLGESYRETFSEEELCVWLERLCKIAPRAVLTGAALSDGGYANASLERGGSPRILRLEKLPAFYPGTGDLFASVLTGSLLLGKSLENGVKCASEFCTLAIRASLWNGELQRNGASFEKVLSFLTSPSRENPDK